MLQYDNVTKINDSVFLLFIILNRLEMVLTSSAEATESLLKEYGDGPRAAGELATYCVLLKRFHNNCNVNLT